MRISDEEKHAAGMVLDDTPRQDAGHDLDRQMLKTVEALLAWRETLNDLPAPAIPKRPPLRITILQNLYQRRKPIAAAAAVLLLAIGVWQFRYLLGPAPKKTERPGLTERTPPPTVSNETAWLAQAQPPRLSGIAEGTISFGATGEQGKGTISGLPPSGVSGTDTANPAVEAFIGQFDFAFRIPQTLPVRWTFRRARPISASRIQLIYQRDEHLLSVFLWKSDKQEAKPRTIQFEQEKRTFITIHAGGIAAAFEGGQSEPETWKKIAASFAPEKNQ